MANRFSKPKEEIKISDSLQDALIYLNKQNIEEGKIYSRRYFSTSAKTSIDVVLAVGVLNGIGPNCYSIISHTKKTVVWGVSDELPDVSEVTLGRLYIFWDSTKGLSYLVYLLSGSRIVEPVKFPLIVYNTEDSHYYYVSSDHITDIYEHLEESYVLEERITTLEKQVKDLIENGGGSSEDESTTTTTTSSTTLPPIDPEPEEPTTTTTTTTPKPAIDLKILSFSSESGLQFESGDVKDIKLVWSYNIEPEAQSINEETLDLSLREKIYSKVSTNTTYLLMAEGNSKSVTSSLSIQFSPISYLGGPGRIKATAITPENFYDYFTEDMDSGLSNVVCKGQETKSFKFDEKSYVLLALPVEIASKLKIYDLNNFETSWVTSDVTVINQYGASITYTVFQSPAASTEFTFVFKYNN